MKSKYKSLISDTLIFAIGSVGTKLILFFLVPLYTNFLTKEEYGISELVFTSSQLLIPFLSIVIFDAVTRFGLSKNEEPKDVLLAGLFVVLCGSIITIAITPILGVYETLSNWKWYLGIYVVSTMFLYVQLNYLKAINKNKLYAVINIFQTLMIASLNILLLVHFKMGIRGYLLSTICAQLVSNILVLTFGGVAKDLMKAKFNRDLLKKMVTYSAPLILNNISWWAIHSSDKLMIEMMLGAAALGLYTVASKIPSLINVISAIFSQAWHISTVKEIENDNDTGFYANIFFIYYMLVFAACIAINTIIKPFMNMYVGAEFKEAWKFVPLLLASASFSSISSFFGAFFSALKKSMYSMLSTLITAIINIVLNFILINKIGVQGAIVATLVSYIVISTIRIIFIERFIKIKINYFYYIINSALIIIQAASIALEFPFYISIAVVVIFIILNVPQIVKRFAKITRSR